MANARLKQARRRASLRREAASRPQEETHTQTQTPQDPQSAASPPQDEREALETALNDRKIALESQLNRLTLGKNLARETEPGCDQAGKRLARAHRDYLLQEMEWMAADFSQERKWRVRNAKMLAQTLVSHLDRQEARLERQKKVEEVTRRRTAARVGRDVKKFWGKIDKIIGFKVKLQADEIRQKHMQKHLKQLVDQTQKYSTALAESFREAQQDAEDSDFEAQDEEDDETTIEKEEKNTTKEEVDEEMKLLQQEGEMTVEELKAKYAAMEEQEHVEVEQLEQEQQLELVDSDSDADFELSEEEEDDERTIAAEERQSGPVSRRQAAKEITTLEEENELSIEELRARYAGAFEEEADSDAAMSDAESDTVEAEDDRMDDEDRDFVPTKRAEEEEADDETTIEEEERQAGDVSPSRAAEEIKLLQEEGEMSIEQLRAKYAALDGEDPDESQDKGENNDEVHDEVEVNTSQDHSHPDNDNMSIASVDKVESRRTSLAGSEIMSSPIPRGGGFKRPYLLTSRLNLREYQEAGVNWLISMCERRINGILADEMGLGKTIQTISMLAHLACVQGLWGPHLIVVPTSCLVNWEMEFKRWCPAFKVLTYFGSAKRRKELRQGWSKQNAFQVCITSYQLVVQDAHCFKRKKWYYLILDEAHNIKNWKSLRWQTLLTFSSQRRLLLTGTPLQNNLLELWALMHFLMPHVFASRKEFSYWFQNPLALMVENGGDAAQQQADGSINAGGGKDLVTQLHGIIRPFVLRRLKKDVAKQLPGKFEHVVTCQLSKRQRFLYEDFISRSSTRRAMYGRGKGRGANFMSMMNVLMQLRKVCNHPDLFEPRPISSPLDMPSLDVHIPARCGYLVDELVNSRPRVPLWMENNLPGLELQGIDKSMSKRRRQLFFYDVSAPLPSQATAVVPPNDQNKKDIVRLIATLAEKRRAYWERKRTSVAEMQELRVALYLDEPVFGEDLIRACTMPVFISPAMEVHTHRARPYVDARQPTIALQAMVRDPEERIASLQTIVNKAVCFVPKARARPARVIYGGSGFALDHSNFVLSRKVQLEDQERLHAWPVAERILAPYYNAFKRTQLFFPDKALVQFDCGKLQQLAVLLRTLKRGGHRCLIFTQMSSMLNILEVFLNLHGHTYFRLDGATKVDKRQMLMERFNRDEKIFCFILSTRSGGLGINLTGADSVIFYDSDWNPAMDAQAQDRAHRIGQTRDVHIYRLVSEHTVEENILRKAQQKRHLDFLVMSEGQFTTDFFSKASLRELMTGSAGEEALDGMDSEIEDDENDSSDDDMTGDNAELSLDTVENAMAQLEDEEDVVAMKGARAEFLQEQNEFDEDAGHPVSPGKNIQTSQSREGHSKPSTPSSVSFSTATSEKDEDEDVDDILNEEEDAAGESNHSSSPDTSDNEGSVEAEPLEVSRSTRKRPRRNKQQGKPAKKAKRLASHDVKRDEKTREKARDAAEEQKLQAWKASVSSLQGFEDSLNPVDRYALHFREDVDPLYAYSPAQQAAALAGVDSDPDAPTLLEDIERVEREKQEEEERLIAEGELVVGRMESDSTDADEKTERYTQLYRRERAHVLFERRKRFLTGAAWSIMKCVNTGRPFFYNADTREATWDRPAVWAANEQLKIAREKGFGGLPVVALHHVLSMLTPYPERYRAQMVCRCWHTAAQHHSLFTKVSASDFDVGSSASLSQVLARVAPGDTVLFGAGVYQLKKALKISKPIRLLAAPDSHVELQMQSGRAQLRWSARGGVICGFHITRTSSANESAPSAASSDVESKLAVESGGKRKRAVLKQEKSLGNWQHLVAVVGEGRLRVEYCELDGNGLGNACICVWGRGEKKKRRKRLKGNDTSVLASKNAVTPNGSLANGTASTAVTSAKAATPLGTTVSGAVGGKNGAPLTTAGSVSVGTSTPVSADSKATTTPKVPTSTTTSVLATATPSTNGSVKTATPIVTPSSVTTPTAASQMVSSTTASTTPQAHSTDKIVPATSDEALLVLQNCRVRSAGSSGVLLVRGTLIMRLNTVEGNAHSGVTILGGQAVLRKNKIQRNARFGLRLLYHAGYVIVEENVVAGNSCGNLDVDNSGRRFVVRWNDMDKGNVAPESLPHSHGQLRLKTFRVVEKDIPRAVTSNPVRPTTAGYFNPNVVTNTAVSAGSKAMSASGVPQARPTMASATSISMMAAAMDLMRSSTFQQLSAMGRAGLPLTAVGAPRGTAHMHLPIAFTSLGAKGAMASVAASTQSSSGGRPNAVSGAASTVAGVARGSAISEADKIHRQRRPRTEEVVMTGREIILRDTCEKRVEKVVKPRRPKDPLTATPAVSGSSTPVSVSAQQQNAVKTEALITIAAAKAIATTATATVTKVVNPAAVSVTSMIRSAVAQPVAKPNAPEPAKDPLKGTTNDTKLATSTVDSKRVKVDEKTSASGQDPNTPAAAK